MSETGQIGAPGGRVSWEPSPALLSKSRQCEGLPARLSCTALRALGAGDPSAALASFSQCQMCSDLESVRCWGSGQVSGKILGGLVFSFAGRKKKKVRANHYRMMII